MIAPWEVRYQSVSKIYMIKMKSEIVILQKPLLAVMLIEIEEKEEKI